MVSFCASPMDMGRNGTICSLFDKSYKVQAIQDFPLTAAKLCVIYTSGSQTFPLQVNTLRVIKSPVCLRYQSRSTIFYHGSYSLILLKEMSCIIF